jgi:cytochrome c peroxidase
MGALPRSVAGPAAAALLAAVPWLASAQAPRGLAPRGAAPGGEPAPAAARTAEHGRRLTQALHGAASMATQLAVLDTLGLPADGLRAPPGVDPELWRLRLPPGLEPTAERVDLGRRLYFDPRLSQSGSVACATCHDVTRGFTDQRLVSEGIAGKLGRRNAPTTLNAALLEEQFWDGRAATVESQALLPITNPIEMGSQEESEVVDRLAALPEYRDGFREAYGRELRFEDIGHALGAFERTLIFLDAPFDRFLAGDQEALSAAARRGFELFAGQARCASCHPLSELAPLGADNRYHNIGVSARSRDFEALARQALAQLARDDSDEALDRLALTTDLSHLGRFMVTRNEADIGAFRTPQLRNVGLTGPYLHDGSAITLWDVLDHYNKGGEDNPYLDGGIEALALSEAQLDDLVEFLFSLTDVRLAEQNQRALATQRERSRAVRPLRDDELAQRRVLGFERRVLAEPR